MKILNFKSLFFLIAFLSIINGCKDDSEKISEFVGNYVISHAELKLALSVTTVQMGVIPVPIGTNITQAIQTSLLSAVSCSSPDKSYVELRKDNTLYLSCEGQSPLDAGTWEEVSSSILKLNMNNKAIPSSPTGFVLTVTDIVKDANGLKGNTSVPLPKAMVAGMIAPLTLATTSPEVFIATFSVNFKKK